MTRPQTIQRAPKDKGNPYRLINRHAMEDDRLTFEARGVLAYILVKPDNWEIQINDLRRAGDAGRDKIYRILNELIAFGYITRHTNRKPNGTIGDTVYFVYENPQVVETDTQGEPLPAEPLPEKPDTAEPDTAEPLPVNTDSNNKEENTNQEEVTKKEAGESLDPLTSKSDPSPTPQPPPAPLATPMIALAEKVAEAESFDRPASAKVATTPPPLQKRRMLQKSGPHFDQSDVEGDYFPAGKGTNPVQIYFERFSPYEYRLTEPQQYDMVTKVKDLDLWRAAITAWDQAGFMATNRKGMLEWYEDPQRFSSAAHKPTTYANGAAKPATSTALADIKLKDWLLKIYTVNDLPTVMRMTNKPEKDLRDEYKQWRVANGLPPG